MSQSRGNWLWIEVVNLNNFDSLLDRVTCYGDLSINSSFTSHLNSTCLIINNEKNWVSYSDKIPCSEEFITSRNSCKCGKCVKRNCSFVLNCTVIGFKVQTDIDLNKKNYLIKNALLFIFALSSFQSTCISMNWYGNS